jgi:hypothetical protein
MITGLVLVERGAEAVATSLGSLVPAVVEGLIGDAVVIAHKADPRVTDVAEIAGAALVVAPAGADPWRAGARMARREWALCLADGHVPEDGWIRSVERFLTAAIRQGHPLGRFSAPASAAALRGSLERWTGTRTVRPGDLVHRAWLDAETRARVRPLPIKATIRRDGLFG